MEDMNEIMKQVKKVRKIGPVCKKWDKWSKDLLATPTDFLWGENYNYFPAAEARNAAELRMYRLTGTSESILAQKAYYLAAAWCCEVGPELDMETSKSRAEKRRPAWKAGAKYNMDKYFLLP